jgi:hypothetical protein
LCEVAVADAAVVGSTIMPVLLDYFLLRPRPVVTDYACPFPFLSVPPFPNSASVLCSHVLLGYYFPAFTFPALKALTLP